MDVVEVAEEMGEVEGVREGRVWVEEKGALVGDVYVAFNTGGEGAEEGEDGAAIVSL